MSASFAINSIGSLVAAEQPVPPQVNAQNLERSVSIPAKIVRRDSGSIDRSQASKVAGVSLAKGDLVLKDDVAVNASGWLWRYAQWAALGPSSKGPAQPFEAVGEDGRQLALERIGLALAAAGVLAAVAKPLAGVPLVLCGFALTGFWYFRGGFTGSRPPLPIFASLPPRGVAGHALEESIGLTLEPVAQGGAVLLSEKLTTASGQLKVFVRQRDPALDARRRKTYESRFRTLAPESVSLGFVGFDRAPLVTWELPKTGKASAGLAFSSPRVLEVKSPVPINDLPQMFATAAAGGGRIHSYVARFVPLEPAAACPTISVAAMIDPNSAGNTLRLTIARAVSDRNPNVKVRITSVSGYARISVGGSFGRNPAVEYRRSSTHGDDACAIATEDDPQKHAPEFALKFSENDEFRPGDRLTIYLVFQKPIAPQPDDAIWFNLSFMFLNPVAGFQRIALFDPLGFPASDRERGKPSVGGPVADFQPVHHRVSTLNLTGALHLGRLLVTNETTFKDPQTFAGRFPDAELVHELITMLVMDHGLAMRDVREDFAERTVWTLLAKDSRNMLSPDVTLRVAEAGTLEGREATSVEISVIAKFSSAEAYDAAARLKEALSEGVSRVLQGFVERRGDELASPMPLRSEPAGVYSPGTSSNGDLAERLASVVVRAENVLDRLERAFSRT